MKKQQFQEAVQEIPKDSPQARVAVQKINFFSAKLGRETKDMLREIFSSVAAEAIKTMLKF